MTRVDLALELGIWVGIGLLVVATTAYVTVMVASWGS